ncbi:MAG: beta-N-acetylhexosaminidase [Bacteroidales bacterium]
MKFQNLLVLAIILLGMTFTACQPEQIASGVSIVPAPQQVQMQKGSIQLKQEIGVSAQGKGLSEVVAVFNEELKKYTSFSAIESAEGVQVYLDLSLNSSNSEAYALSITKKDIKITASSQAGAFYGLQSLLQIIINSDNGKLPCVEISDAPRYEWRGFMLDESRHFFGKEEVKLLLDMMSLQKMNKFHWHLTDSPGWRIEIKKYPLLATVGGKGNNTFADAPAKFYTQEEIKEIVAYAGERFIEVIPEIDMPGHAAAAVRAYPEFDGGGSAQHPNFTFHPAKEGTYQFLTDILREVSLLFPSKYIHIGGDEVHFGNQQWAKFPEVKALMKKENMKSLVDVEHYFLHRMADSIKQLNKTVLAWDEVITAGLSNDNTVVMWWRHDRKQLLKNAIEKNYKVIMCPRRPLYFDFVQHDSHTDGRRWGGFCPVEDVYAFPNDTMTGGNSYESPMVIGVQANAWTEVIHTTERLEFMTFPRLSALAESAWTEDASKDSANFNDRLKQMFNLWDKMDISYFNPFDVESTPEIKGPKKGEWFDQ